MHDAIKKKRTKRASLWLNPTQQQEERQRKRDAVLRSAALAFTEKGFHNTSLSEVAASLGISKPTIYHYFQSKEDILCEVASETFRELQIVMRKVKGAKGIERLRRLMIVYGKSLTVDYAKCVLRTSDADLSEEGRRALAAQKRQIDLTIYKAIEDAIADGSMRPCDVRMATFVVTGALNWIALWHRPDGRLSPDEVVTICTDLVLGGLAAGNETRAHS